MTCKLSPLSDKVNAENVDSSTKNVLASRANTWGMFQIILETKFQAQKFCL